MNTARLEVVVVQTPMRVTFGHASAHRSSSSSVLALLHHDGITGVGEAAPRPYVTGETVASVRRGLLSWWEHHGATATEMLETLPCGDYHDPLDDLGIGVMLRANERCAVELAVRDWLEKAHPEHVPSYEAPEEVPFVPVQDGAARWSAPADVLRTAPLAKIKAGRTIATTLNRIRAARECGAVDVLVDANNAWDEPATALAAVAACMAAGASWFEEPGAVRDLATLRAVRRLGAQTLLDESVLTLEDLDRAHEAQALDAVNLRVAKCGGPGATGRMARHAAERGLQRYYGVQVAEIGTLIPAGRLVAMTDPAALGRESGQPDLFFHAHQLWSDVCPVDRTRGVMSPPPGYHLNGRVAA